MKVGLVLLVVNLCLPGAAALPSSASTADRIAYLGSPLHPEGTSHFPWLNPDAPKGGHVRLPAFGTFDTLNPYTVKGVNLTIASDQRMWGMDALNETLMVGGSEYLPSPDEESVVYCLICKSVTWDSGFKWVRFDIRPDARFHDGSEITGHDALTSFHLLTGQHGHPRFSDAWRAVEGATAENGSITFRLKAGANLKTVMKLGELPVMSARFWSTRDFSKPLLEAPLLSGPYRVGRIQPGVSIELVRVADFWSKDHFYYRGQYNFDSVTYDFFRDRTVAFEAFKSGGLDVWVEYIAKNWATAYDFPALQKGIIQRATLPHQIPASYQFFALNMRKSPLGTPDFRRALTLAFDFEWTNKSLFNDAYRRENSYFPNSVWGRQSPQPSASELALAKRLGVHIPAEDVVMPVTDGSGNDRRHIKEAARILRDAGFKLLEGKLVAPDGLPILLEFLTSQASFSRVIQPYRRNLLRLGIDTRIRLVDDAQFKRRMDRHEFDMAVISWPQAMMPGSELRLQFHSSQASTVGGYNFGGTSNRDVDLVLEAIDTVDDRVELKNLTSLLDRILMAGYYTIPQWYLGHHRIAWKSTLTGVAPPAYSLGFAAWHMNKQNN